MDGARILCMYTPYCSWLVEWEKDGRQAFRVVFWDAGRRGKRQVGRGGERGTIKGSPGVFWTMQDGGRDVEKKQNGRPGLTEAHGSIQTLKSP